MMTDFVNRFNTDITPVLMNRLGDDIQFNVPGNAFVTKCVDIEKSGQDGGSLLDDIFSRLDTQAILLQCLQTDITTVSEGCRVQYQGKNWAVSEIIPRADGMALVVISPDSYASSGNTWQ